MTANVQRLYNNGFYAGNLSFLLISRPLLLSRRKLLGDIEKSYFVRESKITFDVSNDSVFSLFVRHVSFFTLLQLAPATWILRRQVKF